MATTRTPEQIRAEIEAERTQLAEAVEHLRSELGEATHLGAKVKAKLPAVAAGAASTGFVIAGGVGATARYFARRGRERHEQARVGRWSLRKR
jgi:hypothetical protein